MSVGSVCHVLVVEDDPMMRLRLADLLSDAGYPVATMPNGAVALDYLVVVPSRRRSINAGSAVLRSIAYTISRTLTAVHGDVGQLTRVEPQPRRGDRRLIALAR